jgi:hypothetical protein
MEKILKALLAAKVPGVDIDILNEIIQATPNPTIATEMLCGLYEEPVISQTPLTKQSDSETDHQFVKYDKFKEAVCYKYREIKTERYWVKEGETPVIGGNIGVLKSYHVSNYTELAKKLEISEEEAKSSYSLVVIKSEPSEKVRESSCNITSWQ